MPAGLANAHAGISANEFGISRRGHAADDFPFAEVVIERHEHRFFAGSQDVSFGIRQVGKARRDRTIKILR